MRAACGLLPGTLKVPPTRPCEQQGPHELPFEQARDLWPRRGLRREVLPHWLERQHGRNRGALVNSREPSPGRVSGMASRNLEVVASGFPRFVAPAASGSPRRLWPWPCNGRARTLRVPQMAAEKLFDATLALPPEVRLEFASKLLASVEDAPSEDWTQAWLEECDARVAAARSGAEHPVPWDEAYGR